MDDSGRPHAEQQGESQTTNRKEIDHQIDPEWPFESHLSEHPERWDEQGDDDAKDITTSFFITHAMMMRCNATFCVKVAKVFGTRRARCCLRRLYYSVPMMLRSSFTSFTSSFTS